MVPFTPRLIPAILPNLAHHASMIQSAAIRTNQLLSSVIQNLPSPTDVKPAAEKPPPSRNLAASPTSQPSSSSSSTLPRPSTDGKDSVASGRTDVSSPEDLVDTTSSSAPLPNPPLSTKSRGSTMQSGLSDMGPPSQHALPSRPHSPMNGIHIGGTITIAPSSPQPQASALEEYEFFDYQATVNELTIQFLSEHEDTRVEALKWLIMLHQKAPKHVCRADFQRVFSFAQQKKHRYWLWTMVPSLHY